MTAVRVVATHAALYLVTYLVLDFVEDHLTASGGVALAILGVTVPLSFMANLWAVSGQGGRDVGSVVRAALITTLISPLSCMAWLTLYVRVVGYEG